MANFFGRPAHADQLHAEIWWDGENIVRDPGTYRYTAPHPWDNCLARAAYHNAVTVDNQEPMLWAGRFLWLDWSKVNLEFASAEQIIASTDGYKRLNVHTTRSIRTKNSDQVEITDTLTATNQEKIPHTIRLHWLLPDWQWQQQDNSITLEHPNQSKSVTIQFTTYSRGSPPHFGVSTGSGRKSNFR